jgi:hypothetical protein
MKQEQGNTIITPSTFSVFNTKKWKRREAVLLLGPHGALISCTYVFVSLTVSEWLAFVSLINTDNRLTVNCEILATCSSTYSPVRTSQEAHSVSIK